MRSWVKKFLAATCLVFLPVAAMAQTSTIAGEVKDVSGAVVANVELITQSLAEDLQGGERSGLGDARHRARAGR